MDRLKDLYLRYREVISYLFFGGLTTVVSWATYALFVGVWKLPVNEGNFFSWICAVSFAFVTNKLWVFQSKSWAWPGWIKEAGSFFGGRLFSGLVEIKGLDLLMEQGLDQPLFGIDGFLAKMAITVVVMILNFILSKSLAFRKQKHPRQGDIP